MTSHLHDVAPSDPTETNPSAHRWPRSAWIAVGSVALLLVIVLTVTITLLVNGRAAPVDAQNETTAQPIETAAPQPTQSSPTVAPEPPAEPLASSIPLGSPIVSPNYSLIINSVEILDQIETVSGVPIVAPAGTKLVMVRSTITITGNAQDLTCGSDIYMQARDSQGAEMAHVFEGPEIPGNPQCNYKTSAGETSTWNFAFKMGADRTPGEIEVTDTNVDGKYGWGETLIASLS